MGVSSAVFSDEHRHSMVEASGCRCACQGGGEEFDLPPDDPSDSSSPGCCNAQVFTSVLLGILSCVLMTGGVFLAFHRWDPMWLLVSGIGVILIFIGTILHCCSDNSTPARRPSGKGGCCGRPPAPDHHPHIVTHNGSLTEQLLPLTNARSVSQLSLNMLPGYFPPVVTAYGIEQHSAVVQNINRLVQQQQQQQAPNPQSPGNPAGKSFILLSLPGDNPPANLQNLVATVYQLDGSIVPETATTDTNTDTPVSVATRTNNLVVKNAEVQTCHLLSRVSVPNASEPSVVSSSSSAENASSTESQRTTVTTASGTTQTEEHSSSEVVVDLMDCSVDIATNCDTVADSQATFANIPLSSSSTLVDVSEPSTSSEIVNSVLVDVPVSSTNFTEVSVSTNLLDLATTNLVSVDVAQTVINEPRLFDIANISTSNNQPSPSEQSQIAILPNTETTIEAHIETQPPAGTSRDTVIESNPENAPPPSYVALNNLEVSSSSSNLSEIDAEIDDGDFLGRSSPPPSYEDVTHEGERSIGAFGLAYGTL